MQGIMQLAYQVRSRTLAQSTSSRTIAVGLNNTAQPATIPHGHREQFLADFSLALINRTGAYHVCRDLLTHLPQFFAAPRYWRMRARLEPTGLLRWTLGKLMLFELRRAAAAPASDTSGAEHTQRTLFMDPLYVLLVGVRRKDVVLCHDIGPITHPAFFDKITTRMYEKAYRLIAEAKPGVVFVSETSRREFCRVFGHEYRFLEAVPLYVRQGVGFGIERPPPDIRMPSFDDWRTRTAEEL